MARFPRGVVDGGRLAVVHDRRGTLVALDISTGAVLWRQGRALRPCAIHAGAVVAVRVAEPPTLEIVVLDAEDGSERWTSPAIPLPAWARPALDDTPHFTLHCETSGDQIVIHWTARAQYEGGAPPSPQVLDEQAREATGAVRLDLATLSLETLLSRETLLSPPKEPAARARPLLAADVLDSGEAGTMRVELAVQEHGGAEAIVLRAVDPRTGEAVWEVVLDEPISRRPHKLRP